MRAGRCDQAGRAGSGGFAGGGTCRGDWIGCIDSRGQFVEPACLSVEQAASAPARVSRAGR